MELIKSISFSQEQILQDIVALHTGPIHADVTFGMGNFYRPVDRGPGNIVWMSRKEIVKQPRPEFCFDLAPRVPGVIAADVCHLPLRDSCLRSVAFDPPFMARTGPGATLKARFGELVGTIKDLWNFYFLAIREIHRVLLPGGWMVMKCQDGVLSGKNNWTERQVSNYAEAIGFIQVDKFILLATHRMNHPHHTRQLHARKYHSYFLGNYILDSRK